MFADREEWRRERQGTSGNQAGEFDKIVRELGGIPNGYSVVADKNVARLF
jgi:hypothetical protein